MTTFENQPSTDIRLERQNYAYGSVYKAAIEHRQVPNREIVTRDIGTLSGRDNLVQTIMMRLLTPKGELASLGHPEYGSNIHQLIGSRNTETTRSLLRLYVVESLKMEPRIAEIESVQIEPDAANPEFVSVCLRVVPSNETEAVTIGPFSLELEP